MDPDSEAYAPRDPFVDLLARHRDVAVITRPMRDVLRGNETWVNRKGERIPLPDIDANYASNIVAFLEDRAELLYAGEVGEFVGFGCPFNGEMATMEWERAMDETLWMSPDEWLSEQPMYRLLKNLAS